MKKHLLSVILRLVLAVPTVAVAAGDGNLADKFFSAKDNPKLTIQEKNALEISKKWSASASAGTKPIAGPNGVVRFIFGVQQPSVVCAVLQVCDIALQPGEQLNNIHVGDSSRWPIEPAITGAGAGEILHLIVKPLDVGLETSLIVTTNRRTYHIRLKSHRTEYMAQVGFIYPDEVNAKWDTLKTRESVERQEKTIPQTGEYLGELSFAYDIDGSAPWKPVRVYNDGRKTIIEMPDIMKQTEAPSLLVVRKDGGLFTDAETVIVNYRVQGNRFIVDSVFDKAILIAGVGSNQFKVTITGRKP